MRQSPAQPVCPSSAARAVARPGPARRQLAIGTALVLTAAICFGFMPLFNSWNTGVGTKTEMIQFLRFGLAGVVLIAVMTLQKRVWPRRRYVPVLIFMGAGLYVLESLCYFHGIRYAPSAIIVLLLYTCPAVVAVMARVFFRERLGWAKIGAIVLAITGTALALGPMKLGDWRGVALGLGCSFCYAAYIIISSRVISKVGALEGATIVVISAGAVYGIIALVFAQSFPATLLGWTGAASLAGLSTVLALTAFLAGVNRIGAVSAATLSTVEPLVAVLVSQLILREAPMTGLQFLGGAIIILAAIICARLDRSGAASS